MNYLILFILTFSFGFYIGSKPDIDDQHAVISMLIFSVVVIILDTIYRCIRDCRRNN